MVFGWIQVKRLEALERENIRLKRLVAEKELDSQILKETLAVDAKTSEPGKATGGSTISLHDS